MRVNIELNSEAGDDVEGILARLAGEATVTLPAQDDKPAPAPKPAKKAAAPKPKAEPAPEPEEAEEVADEPEEEAEEAAEEPKAKSGGVTVDEATKLATKMIGDGKADKVREALKAAGAKRVSALDDDNVNDFMEAING